MKLRDYLFGAPNRILADRISEIRGGGSRTDGVHMLFQKDGITAADYLLMGCDCSCARRNHPDIPQDQLMEGRWFSADRKDPPMETFWNAHGNIDKNGAEHLESFYTSLPRQKYQASPQEVAWHYLRVTELRTKNVPQEQRIVMLAEEAKHEPWRATT